MANATIYDVSQLAGVSIATVSRVLNNPDRVSAKTRAQVINAIDELNFVPKSEAIARARRSLGRIGILTSTSILDSFVDRWRGLISALSELSYEPIIYDVTSNAQRVSYLTSLPTARQVDGLICIDLPIDSNSSRRLLKYKLPTVQIVASSDAAANADLTTIIHDDAIGGRMAATYLLEQGFRRIGYIGDTGVPKFPDTFRDQKLDGFRQTLAMNGVALPNSLVLSGTFGMESGHQMMSDLLDLPQPPEAVFAASDTQAIGALCAVRERGLRVPEDVAVMGFDNIAVAEYIGLTTVDQQLRDSGRLAIELLVEQMESGHMTAQKVDLSFMLIQRETA